MPDPVLPEAGPADDVAMELGCSPTQPPDAAATAPAAIAMVQRLVKRSFGARIVRGAEVIFTTVSSLPLDKRDL